MGGGAKPIVHGGESLLGAVPGGTRTLAPENTSILVHSAPQYGQVLICPLR